MKNFRIVDVLLLVLVVLGFLGAVKVSLANFQGAHCPHVWIIPICYVVLAAYTLMLVSVLVNHSGCKHSFFIGGWSVAFVIALMGSVMEVVTGGGVCPTSGGNLRGGVVGSIPLCFASLAMLAAILVLFLIGRQRRLVP